MLHFETSLDMPNYTGYESSVKEILGARAYVDFLDACEKDEV